MRYLTIAFITAFSFMVIASCGFRGFRKGSSQHEKVRKVSASDSTEYKSKKIEKVRVAVMEFKASGVSGSVASKVSELARIEIANTGKFILLERSQVDMILKEQGFQQALCSDEECALKVGKLVSAKKILIGTVMKLGDIIIVTARIVDIEKASVESAGKKSVKTETDLNKAVSLLTKDLTGRVAGGTSYRGDADKTAYEADYRGVDFSRTDLKGQNLSNVNMKGANLKRAKLKNAILTNSNLENANLYRAGLKGANLEGANLRRANLERANLKNANLKGANLEGANLERAVLKRANLEGVNLRGANVYKTEIDRKWKTYILKQNPDNYNKIKWK